MELLITLSIDTKSLSDSVHECQYASDHRSSRAAVTKSRREEPSMPRRKTEDSRRQVILHYHIFKNAGTTVESILKNHFRARFARFDSDDYNSTVSNEALLEFLAVHSEVVAITSHHLRPPKPVDDHFVFHDILFLRHPVARLWSTYEFYRRSDLETDPLAGAAKTRSAQEFFQLLTEDYPYHVNNAQVNL